MNAMAFSGIVLAGGYSSRMGTDKALLPIAGAPSYVHVAKVLTHVAEDIWVVRRPDQAPIETNEFVTGVVHDVRPGEGPLAGMEAGLAHMKNSWGLVAPADAPMIRPSLLFKLTTLVAEASRSHADIQAFIFKRGEQIYPLFGCYHQEVLKVIGELLDNGKRRVKDLFDQIHVRYVTECEWISEDPNEVSFWMMNTQEEYQKVRELLEGEFRE